MSLRRDIRRLLRAARRALNAYARRGPVAAAGGGASDGGKGADAALAALDELQRDPTLAALDTTPPRSYAHHLDEPRPAKPGAAAEPG